MRDIDALLREALKLQTDDERQAWLEALTPEEMAMLMTSLKSVVKAAQRFTEILGKHLITAMNKLTPIIQDWAVAFEEAGYDIHFHDR